MFRRSKHWTGKTLRRFFGDQLHFWRFHIPWRLNLKIKIKYIVDYLLFRDKSMWKILRVGIFNVKTFAHSRMRNPNYFGSRQRAVFLVLNGLIELTEFTTSLGRLIPSRLCRFGNVCRRFDHDLLSNFLILFVQRRKRHEAERFPFRLLQFAQILAVSSFEFLFFFLFLPLGQSTRIQKRIRIYDR